VKVAEKFVLEFIDVYSKSGAYSPSVRNSFLDKLYTKALNLKIGRDVMKKKYREAIKLNLKNNPPKKPTKPIPTPDLKTFKKK